jgi:predicted ATPase
VVETQPWLTALHATNAGMYEAAIGGWTAAGRRAFARSANVEAAGHLKAGLELLDHIGDESARYRLFGIHEEPSILTVTGGSIVLSAIVLEGISARQQQPLLKTA